jgi:hypothetical protein
MKRQAIAANLYKNILVRLEVRVYSILNSKTSTMYRPAKPDVLFLSFADKPYAARTVFSRYSKDPLLKEDQIKETGI